MKDVTNMYKKERYSAVILAGGKSSRMKTNKAMLNLHGKSLLQIIVDQLTPFFEEILLISNDPDYYRQFGLPIYGDLFANRGPLAGIHAGLEHISGKGAFFIACDMPFFSPLLAGELLAELGQYQVVVPQKGRFLQPLHAAYRKDCLPFIEQTLYSERAKIISFFDLVQVKYYDMNQHPEYNWDRIFFNVNTPEEYRSALLLKEQG